MSDANPDQQNKLRNLGVFNSESRTLGLPGKILTALVVFWLATTITLFIYTVWWIAVFASLVFAVVLFVPAYLVHEEDPQGYRTWLHTLWAPGKLSTEQYGKRDIRIIEISGSEIEFISLKERQKGNS
ncbi:hypothetical protein HX773_24485 [Pantoea sp. B9002]|uniref:hypothetical protein n=1 Tax=Pantoea sp. B9002 TaxID=2726979 RepID=UPI0015A3AD9B|nr:hypothetical protein [Pantoea sp. B9002]NWA64059.1 hypothetical protein [Pantoea sp. B9002]